jgi:hypothetical protein
MEGQPVRLWQCYVGAGHVQSPTLGKDADGRPKKLGSRFWVQKRESDRAMISLLREE